MSSTAVAPSPAAAAAAVYAGRRDALVDIEARMQRRWADEHMFEADVPRTDEEFPEGKFFITFPYPYMNGRLHLGHGFSMSKSEFAARYQRLKGKNVLWPFGLHVTGTPIAACAQKISNEMRQFGCPPVFPEAFLKTLEEAAKVAKETEIGAAVKHKGRRGKKGPDKPQWMIMQDMGLKDSEIAAFADPQHWLDYFPPLALTDLQAMGCHVDYRRSFITTNSNPFYDSFVRWQFTKLHESGKLGFGKRYCVYSPLDGQPCADHDRASGEGAAPQEYTCVKLRVVEPLAHPALAPFASIIGDKSVFFPAATLRPETVVGQTNFWLSPTITYGAFEVKVSGQATTTTTPSEIYIMCSRAARNMNFQDFTVNGTTWTDPEPLFEVEGEKLIGIAATSPGCPYASIHGLPMQSISEDKGTAVVMSVPSDSPDDYINFIQLVKKPDYRAKLNIKDEWVLPFTIVPIISIPGHELDGLAAQVACEKLKIQGPKDAELLEQAKLAVYQAGFYQGVMSCGPFAGEKVSLAKVKMTQRLIAENNAFKYVEPAKPVMSRSGDVCVVALCDQWYIEYGEEEWRQQVESHLATMETYFPGIRNGFEETLKWLADWPCSRTFGLGTNLPFPQAAGQLIDSLSDSTIYMSYYTAAKYFHAAADGSLNLDGTKPNKYGLTPSMVTDVAWDYLLLGKGTPEELQSRTGMPADLARQIRMEFEYFYPVDLRVSAKDLIPNHLTMFLFNHAAIWPEDRTKWPRSIYCNGHVLVDGEKMSKSKGNFIVLKDALNEYSADGTRMTFAAAGDSLDDANFVRETAKSLVGKIAIWIESTKEKMTKATRRGELNFFDRIFDNTINRTILAADAAYKSMQFRVVLNTVFFEWANDESRYRQWCGERGMHADVVRRYAETVILLLSPIVPHAAEYLWTEVLGHPTSIMRARFPAVTAPVDLSLEIAASTIINVAEDLRQSLMKHSKRRGAAPPKEITVYAARAYHDWQARSLTMLQDILQKTGNGQFPADLTSLIRSRNEAWITPEVMAFIAFAKSYAVKFGPTALSTTPLSDDVEVLRASEAYLRDAAPGLTLTVRLNTDETIAEHASARQRARPGEPAIIVM